MHFNSLRDFLSFLEKDGQFRRLTDPVKTDLEASALHQALIAEKGPVLQIDTPIDANGKAHNIPLLVNLFGTKERIAAALGRDTESLAEIGEMLAFLFRPEPPGGFKDAMDKLPFLKPILSMAPKTVSKAPCQEQIFTDDDVDLSLLPIQTCWPDEPAPLITWPLVVTEGPSAGSDSPAPDDSTNWGVYRMQVIGKNRTIMRWLDHRGGAQHFKRWQKEKGTPMPCAVALGADPASLLAATTPVPDSLPEASFAGLLRGSKTRLVPCKTIQLSVPAEAEIILEGHILSENAPEGPYGDHTGYYNEVEDHAIFEISAITMRKKPIYLSTYTGRPPDEPSILGDFLNDLFVPVLKKQFPEIVDFYLPPAACSYRMAAISIKKGYAGHARRIMMGIWSFLRQFTYTKFLVVTDDDIDIRNGDDVLWAIATRVDPVRDTLLLDNTPVDTLDFAAPLPGLGGKMGIDATMKDAPETTRPFGRPLSMPQDIQDKAAALLKGLNK